MDKLDRFVHELQPQINAEMKAKYGERVFQRWQNPVYMGRIDLTDGYGRITGSCGDSMEIFLKFEKGKVQEARFLTDGCATTLVSGSFAAEFARGKSPEDLLGVRGETILKILGGLPDEDRHCAFLAAEALRLATENYLKSHKKPIEREGKKKGKNAAS